MSNSNIKDFAEAIFKGNYLQNKLCINSSNIIKSNYIRNFELYDQTTQRDGLRYLLTSLYSLLQIKRINKSRNIFRKKRRYIRMGSTPNLPLDTLQVKTKGIKMNINN